MLGLRSRLRKLDVIVLKIILSFYWKVYRSGTIDKLDVARKSSVQGWKVDSRNVCNVKMSIPSVLYITCIK